MKMTIGQKVAQMKVDLVKIVNVCNESEFYGLANVAQSCLQQVGSLSDQLGQKEGETAQVEL